MWKRILSVSVVSLAFTAAASGATRSSLAGGAGLPAGWTHAEINFSTNHVPHTLVLDRGRVTAASATSLTLIEQDGSSVQVALAPTTEVMVDGRPGQLSDIRRGVIAVTQRIDGAAAQKVRVHIPPRLARRSQR